MTRKCNCSGGCGPQDGDVTRREFLELVGMGAAASLAASPSTALGLTTEDLQRWKRALLETAPPRVYRSDVHADARMHLGGIGTGNFEIGADGQLTTWQLFNTLTDGQVPCFFLVKAGQTARLLQTKGGPNWPHIKHIEMTGEYPLAVLRFRDPDLPVQLELTAFSPFAPLDTRLSSVPLAAFVFRIHNSTSANQTVSLATLLQNPVGYDATSPTQGNRHPNFGGNVNEVFRHAGATGLTLRAEAGQEPTLDRPVTIITTGHLKDLTAPPSDRPKELHVQAFDQPPAAGWKLPAPAQTVIWLEEAPADLPASWLKAARKAVAAGATLAFTGKTMPLLQSYAQATRGQPLAQATARPDVLFEDFEGGYEKWTVQGKAFGTRPAHGTLPSQQHVSGFLGKGLVNTFLEGDDTTGRLISQPFTIERNYIRFLVGGGSHPTTQIRLIVDGKTVRATSGKDNEHLLPASWDVHSLLGKKAHIEIVDEQKGPWGHINVDQIEFSDQLGDRAALEVLEELLPARFPDTDLSRLELKPEAKSSTLGSGQRVVQGSLGKGQVVVIVGPILEGGAALTGARQQAYAALCSLVGARYTPPQGVSPKAPGFGSLALATLAEDVSLQPAVEDLAAAWQTFAATGRFTAPQQAKTNSPTAPGHTINGAVAATVTVPAGQTVELPFLLTWHYPNKYNPAGVAMGCHYATLWPDAAGVMREAVTAFPKWREKTERSTRPSTTARSPTGCSTASPLRRPSCATSA